MKSNVLVEAIVAICYDIIRRCKKCGMNCIALILVIIS